MLGRIAKAQKESKQSAMLNMAHDWHRSRNPVQRLDAARMGKPPPD
jgi:hypothetical protein